MKKNSLLVFLVFSFSFSFSYGQAGLLDSTFGINGTSLPYFPTHGPTTIAVDANGKILTCGYNQIYNDCGLVRYNQNGTPDSTFGIDGLAEGGNFGNQGDGMCVQPDGKILVCSYFGDFQIARYLNDGSADISFGVNGGATVWVPGSLFSTTNDVKIQADGKIIATGVATFAPFHDSIVIARFNNNGLLDSTFGTNGITITKMGQRRSVGESIAIQADGKYVVGGWSDSTFNMKFALVRYNNNGVLDNTFGIGGKVEPFFNDSAHFKDICTSIVLQNDGKIIMTGNTHDPQSKFALLRINTDGSIDSSFGNNGLVKTDFLPIDNLNEAYDVILQPDGKIIAVGYAFLYNSYSFENGAIARYNIDGTLDSTFGQDGKVVIAIDSSTGFSSVAMQEDGKIVVSGQCATYGQLVWRFLSGLDIGVIDTSNPNNPILIYPNPIHSQATLQYTLNEDEQITIELFDMQGKMVQPFIINEARTTGKHEELLCFNELLLAGNYILNISNGRFKQGVKIVLQ